MPNDTNNTDGHEREHPVAQRAAETAKAETISQGQSSPQARQDFGPAGLPGDRVHERDAMGNDRGPYAPGGARGPQGAPLPGVGRRNG